MVSYERMNERICPLQQYINDPRRYHWSKCRNRKSNNCGRSKEKLEAVKTELGNVEIGICDISSLSSMDKFIKSIGPIDILVNNAGINLWGSGYQIGELNQELTFQTNHLGTMYLSIKLMEHKKLNDNATIVVVSSDLHTKGVDDLEFYEKQNEKNFDGMATYSQSKLFNLEW